MVYLYFFVVSFFIIPSGDDYFWWGEKGHYLLTHNFFSTEKSIGGSANGRYLGNLFEISIMHSPIFAAIVYATVITLFIWCLWKLTGHNKISLIGSLSFFVITQIGYFQNVLFWFAGFSNYLPPITALLLYFVWLQKYLKTKQSLSLYVYFILSVVGGLYVEHMTLFQVFVGILTIVLIKYLNKKDYQLSPKIAYSYTMGAILSAIIMFSHSSYYYDNGANYHQVSLSFSKCLNSFVNVTHFWLFTFNYLLIVIICFAIALLVFSEVKNKILKYSFISLSAIFSTYYLVINLYIQTNYKIDYYVYKLVDLNQTFAMIDSIVGFLVFIFIVVATLILFKGIENLDIKFYLFCSFALAVPFFIILSPLFIREYFSAYVFLFMITIIYVNKIISIREYNSKKLIKLLSWCVLIGYGAVMFMMASNYQVNMQRVNDNEFLYEYKLLKRKVPYSQYVSVDDMKMMQSPIYWRNRLNFKWKDYFYNGVYK